VALFFVHKSMQYRWNKCRHAGTWLHIAPCANTSRQIAQTCCSSDALASSVEYGKYPSFTAGAGAGDGDGGLRSITIVTCG
jgi:hypothetical protein